MAQPRQASAQARSPRTSRGLRHSFNRLIVRDGTSRDSRCGVACKIGCARRQRVDAPRSTAKAFSAQGNGPWSKTRSGGHDVGLSRTCWFAARDVGIERRQAGQSILRRDGRDRHELVVGGPDLASGGGHSRDRRWRLVESHGEGLCSLDIACVVRRMVGDDRLALGADGQRRVAPETIPEPTCAPVVEN